MPGIYIINRGEVRATKQGKLIAELKRGDVVGGADRVQRNEPSEFTFMHDSTVNLFFINSKSLSGFINDNPGSVIRISYTYRID